jgi:hypothetical protein
MCTWTANSRQISPVIQRYIHTSVQRSDSNSSENWVMGVSVARVLLSAYFPASSRHRGRRQRNSLLGAEQNWWEGWFSGRVAKTSWRENKSDGAVELGLIQGLVSVVLGKGLPFNGRSGLQRSSKPAGVSCVYNTELDNGPPVRSRWRERGCRKRWQSGVMTSYGRGTAKDDVQQSEESVVMGRITRRAQCISILSSQLQLREFWQRFPSILSYSLARFRWCGGCDLGSWTDKQWMTLALRLFENLDCSRKLSTSTAYLIGKELMLRECRDWRQETKSTVIIQLDFYEEKGKLVKGFRNFVARKSI